MRTRRDKQRAAWKHPDLVRKAEKRLAAIVARKRAAAKAEQRLLLHTDEDTLPSAASSTALVVYRHPAATTALDDEWCVLDPVAPRHHPRSLWHKARQWWASFAATVWPLRTAAP